MPEPVSNREREFAIKCKGPSVLLIYTGGTIGMVRNEETGALESFDFDSLLEQVPELRRFDCHISTYTFSPPIDSSDMSLDHWERLVRIIEYNYCYFDGIHNYFVVVENNCSFVLDLEVVVIVHHHLTFC